eukprot:12778630-Alexandrium_andersonii.AAC.1
MLASCSGRKRSQVYVGEKSDLARWVGYHMEDVGWAKVLEVDVEDLVGGAKQRECAKGSQKTSEQNPQGKKKGKRDQ